jgi:hypothetical protein
VRHERRKQGPLLSFRSELSGGGGKWLIVSCNMTTFVMVGAPFPLFEAGSWVGRKNILRPEIQRKVP